MRLSMCRGKSAASASVVALAELREQHHEVEQARAVVVLGTVGLGIWRRLGHRLRARGNSFSASAWRSVLRNASITTAR